MRLIDADNLKKDIAKLHVLHDEKEIRRLYYANPHTSLADFEEILVRIFDAIEAAPTIEARPKGEWIYHKNELSCVRWSKWECSACGERQEHKSNFCPNCGADMRERKESE